MVEPVAAGAELKRRPQQARSRARVQAILDAADGIIAAGGFEALTIRAITERAGVPVGSIYQFFPDKSAIVDALGRHYLEGFDGAIAVLVERSEQGPMDDLVGTVVDAFADMYRENPGYVALWTGRHLSPELAQEDRLNNATIMVGVRRILRAQLGLRDGIELERAGRIAVWVADSVLQHVFRENAEPEHLEDLKRMLRLYLDDLVARISR
ncbi:TetR/AcrR family transcriptional regulator [Actinocorallia longicatena]|uniref:TetR family transcriptional regulator n=1 Tax=Actinocorallia longicatena TaxID=111803 RepID=A0ABP6QG08_9ACTN